MMPRNSIRIKSCKGMNDNNGVLVELYRYAREIRKYC